MAQLDLELARDARMPYRIVAGVHIVLRRRAGSERSQLECHSGQSIPAAERARLLSDARWFDSYPFETRLEWLKSTCVCVLRSSRLGAHLDPCIAQSGRHDVGLRAGKTEASVRRAKRTLASEGVGLGNLFLVGSFLPSDALGGTHDAKRQAPVHGHTGDVPSDEALSDRLTAYRAVAVVHFGGWSVGVGPQWL
eukprot:scaffold8243_cov129-Isochrysis_galbana.AAC.8